MTDHQRRLAEFFRRHTRLELSAGQTFIWGGREPDGVYYLESGRVRQSAISEHTGNVLTIHVYHPGSFFPMIWAMTGKRNLHFFDAAAPTIVYRSTKQAVLEYLRRDAEALYHFTTRVLAGLHGLTLRLETYVFTDVYGRVVSSLLYLAKHYGQADDHGVVLPHFTHQEIADFIGSARETTSVAMEKLERSGLVVYMGHNLYLPSLDRLVAELNKKRRR